MMRMRPSLVISCLLLTCSFAAAQAEIESAPSPSAAALVAGGSPCTDLCQIMKTNTALWSKCCDCVWIENQTWASLEYLNWKMKDFPLPVPLLTSGSGFDNPTGALGQPNTQILYGGSDFGGSDLDLGSFSGTRITMGMWLDCDQTCGIEARAFFLGQKKDTFEIASRALPGEIELTMPFFSSQEGIENALGLAVNFPLDDFRLSGGINITAATRLWGAEINLIQNLTRTGAWSFDALLGARYLDLDEHLSLRSLATPDNVTAGFSFVTFNGALVFDQSRLIWDQFSTRNQFYGGQVGARGEYRNGPWTLSALGKVAIGSTRQTVDIQGLTALVSLATGETTAIAEGGLYAQRTNIGRHKNDEFTVIPELELKVSYQVCDCAHLFVGYNALYWDKVIRPGSQIDRMVDRSQAPSSIGFVPATEATRPAPVRNGEENIWIQGVNVGMEIKY